MYNYIPFVFDVCNCCATAKENEKRIAKMCAESARIDFVVYEYIRYDLENYKRGVINGKT